MSAVDVLQNCSYSFDNAVTLGERLVNTNFALDVTYGIYACTPFKWEYLVNLAAVVFWLIVARWLYDVYMRIRRMGATEKFSLANELTKRDNPALAIDFASFLFSICLITRGSLTDLAPVVDNARYFGAFCVYQALGFVVILLSRFLNDKLMLRKVHNVKAMIEDRSVSVGCVQAGATISTALIFSASASGFSQNMAEGIASTLIYWVIGQVLLIGYGNIVDIITSLPVLALVKTELVRHPPTSAAGGAEGGAESDGSETAEARKATSLLKEASDGNAAAGLAVGFDLVHAGILIAAPIYVGYSLVAWIIWTATTLMVVSPLMHLYLDHIVLRGAAYTVNILRHQNWGAALLIGALKVLLSLVLMASYKDNCVPSKWTPVELGGGECLPKIDETSGLGAHLSVVTIPDVFNWQVLLNLLLLLLQMVFAKVVFYLRFACKDRGFSLDKALCDPRNNAVATSLAAYTFAQGLLLVGIAVCPNENPGMHAADMLLWQTVGCALLLIAFKVNDVVLLFHINNTQMLIQNNMAVALLEGGSFIACGIVLRATLTGGGDDGESAYGDAMAFTVLYWILCQVLLIVFAFLNRLITKFDDWDEYKNNNASAGLSSGITLVALAVAMAFPIMYYESIIIFLPIALTATVALIIVRFIVDIAVLPGDRLDSEISKDKNWGAALIEGAVAVGVAFISNLYVPPPGAPYVNPDTPYFDVCGLIEE